jgi:hypothetical protein
MTLETPELLTLIDEMLALVKRQGSDYWVEWLTRDAEKIRNGDPAGVDHFVEAFWGSMGSFQDVMFTPVNGNAKTNEENREATERLDRLQTQAWEIAHRLQASRRAGDEEPDT